MEREAETSSAALQLNKSQNPRERNSQERQNSELIIPFCVTLTRKPGAKQSYQIKELSRLIQTTDLNVKS